MRTSAFGRSASTRAPAVRIAPSEIALQTVRKIAYNLSNNYDGDRLSEEHVEIEEEI
jgi:hypothetical protein